MEYRIEHDTMGEVKVPADKYWGAQTQRSRDNFKIGGEKNQMPLEVVRAFAILKKSAAETNMELGVLPKEKSDLIGKVCDEILAGVLDDQFPLVVWQTGSGTQSNMNSNEVIANRAHVLNGGSLTDDSKIIHPSVSNNKAERRSSPPVRPSSESTAPDHTARPHRQMRSHHTISFAPKIAFLTCLSLPSTSPLIRLKTRRVSCACP